MQVLGLTSPAIQHSPVMPNAIPAAAELETASFPYCALQKWQGAGVTLGGFCLRGEQLGDPVSPQHCASPPHPHLALAKPLPWARGSSWRQQHHGGVGCSSSACAAVAAAEKEVFVCRCAD